MFISEINPFVRFAAEIVFSPQKAYSISPDCRLFLILKGDGEVKIKNQTFPLDAALLIYIPAGTPYKFLSNNTISAIAINFDFSQNRNKQALPFAPILTNDISEYTSVNNEIIDDCAYLCEPIILSSAAKFVNPFKEILRENTFQNLYSKEIISAKLKLLITNLLIEFSKVQNLSKTESKIEKAAQFIRDNYKNNIDNDSVAKAVGYHPYHLNRIFQKQEGVTIHKYINNYRIVVAEQLLLSTDISITTVATEVGYNNSISFTENFKRKNGLTPSKYRSYYRQII